MIEICRNIAMKAHAGQKRDGGGDYFIEHVLPVATMVDTLCQNNFPEMGSPSYVDAVRNRVVMLCVAYLHDVIEDCGSWVQHNDLEKILRDEELIHHSDIVTQIMECLKYLTTSGLRSPSFYDGLTKIEKFDILFKKAPIAACIVKLCDRASNLETMGESWDQKRQDKYREQAKQMGDMFRDRISQYGMGIYAEFFGDIIHDATSMYNHVLDEEDVVPVTPIVLNKYHDVDEFYDSNAFDQMGREWNDISTNEYREYIFPDGFIVRIDCPMKLNVSESGGHRILDADGMSWYVPSGWRALRWMGEPHFVM